MKKLYLLSILFIVSCASTPKEASADMAGINVSPVTQEEFESKHGCFTLTNTHAKKQIKFFSCFRNGLGDAFKFGFTFGLAKERLEKINDVIFIDVFNEFKNNNEYLENCSVTDLIRLEGIPYTVELLYKCEED